MRRARENKRGSETTQQSTADGMEELIRLRIAELEENYPQQGLENKLIHDIIQEENNLQYDESELCRPFDSEVG